MIILINQIKMEKTLIQHTISLDSNQESINKLTSYIDSIYEKYGALINDKYGNVIIAMTEAVNNAITHGNKKDLDKKVTVNFKKNEGNLTFTVQDEGEGFDYENVPDPTSPENLEKLNGRGIFLMKNLVDEITFHDMGKKIELKFQTL